MRERGREKKRGKERGRERKQKREGRQDNYVQSRVERQQKVKGCEGKKCEKT